MLDPIYRDFAVEQAVKLLSIDSPSGYTEQAAQWVLEAFQNLGCEAHITTKGGVLACLGGEDADHALMLEAHTDTLGGMVAQIKPDGRLRITALGGMQAANGEAENVKVYTRDGRVYEGTLQLINASVHVNGDYAKTQRSFDTTEVVLDEDVKTRADVEKLGIMNGDIVCFDPRTHVTASGYIKSRFLDDKLSVGILLGLAKYIHDTGIQPQRRVYAHITVYEEVGHGGAGSLPQGVTDAISVDMGCVGDDLGCHETQVSICAKDSAGPYDYDFTTELVQRAQKLNLDYVVDIYPGYSSDTASALKAGLDARFALCGQGVYASHGYERTHIRGMLNTLALVTDVAEHV